MATEPKRRWRITRPLPGQANMPEFEICVCDTAEAVAAVIKALLSAGEKMGDHLTITEYVDL